MSGFQPTEAALEGFRITRENPKAFGAWIVATFGVGALSPIVEALMPESVKKGLATINANDTPTPAQLADALIVAAPILVLGLLVERMMAAAVYRLIFRHDDTRFGYLRLGADEVRLVVLRLVYVFLIVGGVFAGLVVSGFVVGFSALFGGAIQTLAGAAMSALFVGGLVYLGVRLSLAPVATFAERRLVIFDSWRLTRGKFLPLLGAYALALSCIVVIGMLVLVIFSAVATAVILASGGSLADVAAMRKAPDATLSSYLSVGLIAYMLVSAVFGALYNAVVSAPGAVAYRHLHDLPPEHPYSAQPEAG
jgi:hypothetical protein